MRRTVSLCFIVIIMLALAYALYPKTPPIPAYLQNMGHNFTVQTVQGPMQLDELQGNVVLLYFGYTHCPDVCPMALGVMAASIKAAQQQGEQNIKGLFVSLDPDRDKVSSMSEYTAFFSPDIIAATADEAYLTSIAKDWRLSYRLPKKPRAENYALEHSTFIYLLNKQGQLVALFDEKTSAEFILQQAQAWLDD